MCKNNACWLAVKNKVYNKIHTFMLCDENMLKVQRDKFKGVTVYSVQCTCVMCSLNAMITGCCWFSICKLSTVHFFQL